MFQRVSPLCRQWQTEYLACEPIEEYERKHPSLFNNVTLDAQPRSKQNNKQL